MVTIQSKILTSFVYKFDRYDLAICIGVILYSAIFSYLTLLESSLFQLGRDVAIFNQALWTTVYSGGILENSVEGVSHFGYHFSPILFTFIPLYLVSPGPHVLLICQSILIGLGAIPIYLCGRELLGSKEGLIMGLLYLIYPAVHGANLFAFHELAFLPFFLGLGLWGYITDRRNLCFLACAFCLLIKEDVSLIIGMIGLLGIFQIWKKHERQDWRFYLLLILSVSILLIYLFAVKPAFGLDSASDSTRFTSQYVDPVSNLNGNETQRIEFLIQMFLPLLFSPLGSPELLIIVVPSLIEILFSSPDIFVYYNIFSHYPLLLTPVLFMSAILSLRKVKYSPLAGVQKLFSPLLLLMVISSSVAVVEYSPVHSLGDMLSSDLSPRFTEDQETLQTIGSLIPTNASVSTQWQLLTLMSERKDVWEGYDPKADVILIFPYYTGANVFSGNKSEIIQNYDQISKGKEIYLFVRKDKPELRQRILSSLTQHSFKNM